MKLQKLFNSKFLQSKNIFVRVSYIFLLLLAILLFAHILNYGVKTFLKDTRETMETMETMDATDAMSALPQGIPRNQIPNGDEDLYIKKSEIVPPVCPKCPDVTACPSTKEKCPPCPACARCPQPSYQCQLVPNYDAMGDDVVPRPVLTDFSNFGM